MSESEKFTTPQEMFQTMTDNTTEFLKGFSTQQNQEMLTGFMRSWQRQIHTSTWPDLGRAG